MYEELARTVQSTEAKTIEIESSNTGQGTIQAVLSHTPRGWKDPIVSFQIDVWSHNLPVMVIRHITTNLRTERVEDLRLFNFMDFDIGGPRSYKDDFGKYDKKSGVMLLWDDNPLYIALASRPKPDGWDITAPAKLKIDDDRRDLKNNLETGPKDIATGIQWNLGDLDPGESKSVEMVIASAQSREDVLEMLKKGRKFIGKKIR